MRLTFLPAIIWVLFKVEGSGPVRSWHLSCFFPTVLKMMRAERKGAFQCHMSLPLTNLLVPQLSPGHLLCYSELYQMWQLWFNKVDVFNKCSFSWICTEREWKIVSSHLEALSQAAAVFDVWSLLKVKADRQGLSIYNEVSFPCTPLVEIDYTVQRKRRWKKCHISQEIEVQCILDSEHISSRNEVALECERAVCDARFWE